MKSAEEWLIDLDLPNAHLEQIKQIQLDAWKQGMSDALFMLDNTNEDVAKISSNIRKLRDTYDPTHCRDSKTKLT